MADEAEETSKPRLDRMTWIFIIVGIVILVVPASYLLTVADSAFRDECKANCAKTGMDYRVIPLGASAPRGEYPAECRCVPSEPKKWWRFWR
jgi:hypothetical protein